MADKHDNPFYVNRKEIDDAYDLVSGGKFNNPVIDWFGGELCRDGVAARD